MNTQRKIITRDELSAVVAELKKGSKKIVTTNGAFDILHVGHKRALEATRALGDVLIIGVNSDASVKQYKSDKRPIVSDEERAEMLAGLACVDYVTIFPETDPIAFLSIVQPDIHTKSGDYTADELKEAPTVRANGGEVVIVPFVGGKSTTGIIERILNVYGKMSAE